MARDYRLIVKGDTRNAEAALNDLHRAGVKSASLIEREFDQLGTASDQVFENKREAARSAYQRITQSGMASSAEMIRAEKALGRNLAKIDEEQFGKRLSMADTFRKNWVKIAATAGAIAGVGVAGFSLGKKALNEYEDFESALTDLGKVGVKNLGGIRDEIMALPPELGSATDLVKGYYQTISAGVTDPKRAMELLTTAARGAKAAHVEQGEMIKALTKLMAGFGDEISSAEDASDLLFNMERFGQTTVAELTPVIGGLASLSSQLNVMPREMAAVVAQITQTAGSTAEAATQYEAILSGFIKPTKSMTEVFEKLGVDSGKQLIAENGLVGALMKVKGAAEESFGPGGLGKIFESKEAITAMGPLIADEFENVTKTIDDMGASAGATDDAFEEWKGTFKAVKEAFNNTLGKVLIDLGQELAPKVIEAMKSLTKWINENRPELVSFFESMAKALGWVAESTVKIINMTEGASGRWQAFWGESSSPGSPSPAPGAGFAAGTPSGGSADPNAPFGSYATGTAYVPRTGLYQLHRGEEVRTRGEASRDRGGVTLQMGDLNVTVAGSAGGDPRSEGEQIGEAAARKLYQKFREYDRRFAPA